MRKISCVILWLVVGILVIVISIVASNHLSDGAYGGFVMGVAFIIMCTLIIQIITGRKEKEIKKSNTKRLSFFKKWFVALGFASLLGILFEVSKTHLRAANFLLVNPFVKGLTEVVGYYELIIIGVPLIGGFLVGVVAVWFYTEDTDAAQQKEE